MSLKRYRTVICVGWGMLGRISLEERDEMVRKAEKILKEEDIKFHRLGYDFWFEDTRGIEEAKLQKYVKRLFRKEGVHFVFWHKSLEDAPQTDDELIEYLKKFLFDREELNITEIREELKIGKNRAIRLMDRLVEEGLAFPREKKFGGKWRVRGWK